MTFDLSYAPMDVSATLKRAVALATGTAAYVAGAGDPVTPEDVRMGKVFAIHDLLAQGSDGHTYAGSFNATGGPGGTPAVFWFDTTTGLEAANGISFAAWGAFPVEVVGQ